MFTLNNKHILITGASSGMGAVFAKMLSELGARVSLLARNEERLQQTVGTMVGEGHKYYVCDLTNEEQANEVVAQIDALDGIVFCAGIN